MRGDDATESQVDVGAGGVRLVGALRDPSRSQFLWLSRVIRRSLYLAGHILCGAVGADVEQGLRVPRVQASGHPMV